MYNIYGRALKFKDMKIVYIKYQYIEWRADKSFKFVIDNERIWLPKKLLAVNEEKQVVAIPDFIARDRNILHLHDEKLPKMNPKSLWAAQNIIPKFPMPY